MFVSNLESIKIKIASPQDILDWSYGEVTKPELLITNSKTGKGWFILREDI